MTQPSRDRLGRRVALLKQRARLLGRPQPPSRLMVSLASPKAQAALPWFITALILAVSGGLLISLSITFASAHQQAIADALMPVGVLLLAASTAPFILGSVRLTDTPTRSNQRCGRCKFYIPSSTDYGRGVCHVERPQRAVTSENGCSRFVFSERAMVRERLNEAPHVLKPAAKHD